MRFVVKPDEHKTAKLASEATYQKLLDIAQNKRKDKIKDGIYREPYDNEDEKRSRVEDQLAISYYNKCGYCERLCKADIEHYRPKKGVDEDNNHDGYYWLCYEWTNLLPSCVKCNRDGGKHNKFPILGVRVYTPPFLPDDNLDLPKSKAGNDPLVLEIPYLLHPEVDNPEGYFEFELDPSGDGIRLKGIDTDDRGTKTIDICSLNRQELRLERVENVINPFKMAIESAFAMYAENIISGDDLENHISIQIRSLKNQVDKEEITHTLLRKYVVSNESNFEAIVIPYLIDSIQEIVLEAFKSLSA